MAFTVGGILVGQPTSDYSHDVYLAVSLDPDGKSWAPQPPQISELARTSYNLSAVADPDNELRLRAFPTFVCDPLGHIEGRKWRVIYTKGRQANAGQDWKIHCATWDLYCSELAGSIHAMVGSVNRSPSQTANRMNSNRPVKATGRCIYRKLGLAPADDPHADTALNHPRLLSIQEHYVSRVLTATREFGNVIYEVANETGGARWVAHFVEFIHQHWPGALGSAGEQSSAYDPMAGRCDLVVKHRGAGGLYRTDEDVARHRRSLISFRRAGKPVLHNEFFLLANRSTDDPSFVRKMFWADFTGGGHANFYDFTWWRGTGRTVDEGTPSRPPPSEVLNAAKFLRRFVEEGRVPFWVMAPHDELAGRTEEDTGPFVLAQPGAVVVVYLIQGGPVRLDLSGTLGLFTARWFNPRDGKFSPAFATQAGRQMQIKAPDEQDWALLLQKTSPETE